MKALNEYTTHIINSIRNATQYRFVDEGKLEYLDENYNEWTKSILNAKQMKDLVLVQHSDELRGLVDMSPISIEEALAIFTECKGDLSKAMLTFDDKDVMWIWASIFTGTAEAWLERALIKQGMDDAEYRANHAEREFRG